DDLAPLAAEAIALELCTELARASRERPASAEPAWLARVRAFLHDEFRSALTAGRIAEVAGVHPVHLARVFRAHHGASLGAYVRRLRLEWAAEALAGSDAPLATVALQAGFFDQSHFSRAFRAHTGVSPGAWRARRRS
ncbi:MAG TPA: AraC family transcriptional regulator, partial [Longimicrobium sp.]